MNQSYRGRLYYASHLEAGAYRLLVAVPCRVGDLEDPLHALFDTGSTWCVLPPTVATALGYELPDGGTCRLHSRLGLFSGELVRERVTFASEGGDTEEETEAVVAVEATFFLCSDWPGPLVLGWMGCLERMRFAFDPGENAFYFAELAAEG
jgi:hypothetical protein